MFLEDIVVRDVLIPDRVIVFGGVLVINPVDLGAFEDRLARHLIRAQRRGGVRGEIWVARPRREDTHTAFFKVADCPAPDIGFAHLVHWDRADNAGENAKAFKRGLHRQRIHHGRQHPHVIRRRPLHPLGGALKTPEDVAAADDHTDLDPEVMNRLHLVGDSRDRRRVQAIALIAHQRFAGNLEKNAFVRGLRGGGVRCVGHDERPFFLPFASARKMSEKVPVFNGSNSRKTLAAEIIQRAGSDRPILIAGATASGKSALALDLAEKGGGVIVNADAIQVYSDWRILTARPSKEDEAAVPHHLYGHVDGATAYSTGQWVRELEPHLSGPRPIIVGGTGLNFTALTEGLAEIPPTPKDVRDTANARLVEDGPDSLLAELDPDTAAKIDVQNPVRIQRAWEVQATTGRGLASWHADTPPPRLSLSECVPILLHADKDWLNDRIEKRARIMLESGVLDEAAANRPTWSETRPSAKAIGAKELMQFLNNQLSEEALLREITVQTRQYAKRQRTWFRGRMGSWTQILCP